MSNKLPFTLLSTGEQLYDTLLFYPNVADTQGLHLDLAEMFRKYMAANSTNTIAANTCFILDDMSTAFFDQASKVYMEFSGVPNCAKDAMPPTELPDATFAATINLVASLGEYDPATRVFTSKVDATLTFNTATVDKIKAIRAVKGNDVAGRFGYFVEVANTVPDFVYGLTKHKVILRVTNAITMAQLSSPWLSHLTLALTYGRVNTRSSGETVGF